MQYFKEISLDNMEVDTENGLNETCTSERELVDPSQKTENEQITSQQEENLFSTKQSVDDSKFPIKLGSQEIEISSQNSQTVTSSYSTKSDDESGSELHATDSLMISESDEENILPNRGKRNKITAIIESDNEEFDGENKVLDENNQINVNNKLKELCSSDSGSESDDKDKNKKHENNSYDSEEASENDDDNTRNSKGIHRSKNHPQRAAAKVALREIYDIKSETQRLSRETHIRVPYHKPKQHTLKEFLTRKALGRQNNLKNSNLKMTQEELEAYAKYLEERAKEASEFFKSASDNENEDNKKNENNLTEENNSLSTLTELVKNNQDTNEILADKFSNHLEQSQPDEVLIEKTNENSMPVQNDIMELKRTVLDSNICSKPILKGDSNMVIDLETGDLILTKPNGVDNLLNKFLKHSIPKKSKCENNVRILSTENGQIEMADIALSFQKDTEINDQKPGLAHMKLKNNLKEIIFNKRKREMLKKAGQVKNDDEINFIKESEEEIDEMNELDEEILETNESDADDEFDSEEEDEDEITDNENYHENKCKEEEEEDQDKEEIYEKNKKSRIIQAFEDSEDEIENATRKIDVDSERLLWIDQEKKMSEEESQLMELCSGKFENTQKIVDFSQIPTTQLTQNVDENELYQLCSGTFNTEKIVNNQQDSNYDENHIESSDEESFQKKKSKKNITLKFSDDEEENENTTKNVVQESGSEKNEDSDVDSNGIDEDDTEEVPEMYIDYDSEENEIEVKMSKNDRIERAEEFFENEAELSESEWGSADEDEKDLDRYDIELGDEENFDKQKIRTELEQIHLRKMLDQDMREVKKLQELFFEDEENDGIGRQRQFRWKHLETDFTFNKLENEGETNEQNKTDDEENEELWRKIRHDRELVLKEKNKEAEQSSSLNLTSDINLNSSMKKITIIKSKLSSDSSGKNGLDSPFLISATNTTAIRGSFLVRDNETLSKLAHITKSGIDSDGTAGTVQVTSRKSKNFVFTTLPGIEEVGCKRKSEHSPKQTDVKNKRQKTFANSKTKKRLIDHLL